MASETRMPDTVHSEWFAIGWRAAIREAVLRNESGQIDEFLNEQGTQIEESK